jgi:hypothetical protein
MKAKSISIIVALCLLGMSQVNAQVFIKAGINIASLSDNTISDPEFNLAELDQKSTTGFQGGIGVDLPVSSMFYITPELMFIQKGGKNVVDIDENNRLEQRIYYNYIEVPVLAKLKFMGEDSGTGFYFNAGPFAGLALGGRYTEDRTVLGVRTERNADFNFENKDEDDFQKRLDWGIAFGWRAVQQYFPGPALQPGYQQPARRRCQQCQ